jgi:ABC-type multidrug transport system ATPase subunit
VDIHVGTYLIEETIMGLLRGRTVVMATHAIRFAPKADYIILMKDGQVVACDKYREIAKRPEFREVEMKIMEREKDNDNDPEEVNSIIHSIIEE